MGSCKDKRFERMISSYELNLLSSQEQEEFELHLLECDYCFDRVEQFKAVAERMNRSSAVRETINQVVSESETKEGVRTVGRQTKRWRTLVPATLGVLLVALLLVLKPWHIEVSPTHETVAAENRVAVMYFSNLSGNEESDWLGQAVTNLLITDLSESRYLQVVSSQRLYDLLQRLRQDETSPINRSVATTIAKEAGARWMLLGDIIRDEPELALAARLVDIASGDVISSQKIIGSSDQTVFSLVDRLSHLIRLDLGLPEAASYEPDPKVADITTHSTEAYRYYLEGVEFSSKLYWAESTVKFKKALEFDSTFAMAYYHLARLDNKSHIAKAVEYSQNASQKEQMYIRSREAYYSGRTDDYVKGLQELVNRYPDEKEAYLWLGSHLSMVGHYEKALDYLKKSLEIDPLYKEAMNELAYLYDHMGEFDEAMETLDRYQSLAPDEANPYDSRGEILANNGMIDEAIESYKRAIEIKPDFYSASFKVGNLYRFKRDFDKAEYWYKQPRSASVEGLSLEELVDIANIYVDQGKIRKALAYFDEGWSSIADKYNEENAWMVVEAHVWKAKLLRHIDLDKAIEQIESAIEIHGQLKPNDGVSYRVFHAELLAERGDSSGVDVILKDLKASIEASGEPMQTLWYATGAVALMRGDAKSAVKYMEQAIDTVRPLSDFNKQYLLALSYLLAGESDRAIVEFERQIATYYTDRLRNPIRNILMHYHLGTAYAESGRFERAVEQYKIFLNYWQEVDCRMGELEDARERLTQLQTGS